MDKTHSAPSAQAALFEAADNAEPRRLALAIEAGAGVDKLDDSGQCALLRACSRKSFDCVEILLAAGANPNPKQDSQWMSPFGLAIEQRRTDLFNALLAAGASPHGGEGDVCSPLRLAIGSLPMLKSLLDAGADPLACERPPQSPSWSQVERGASSAFGRECRHAIDWAVQAREAEALDALLDKADKAAIKAGALGGSLETAVAIASEELVLRLLAAGAKPFHGNPRFQESDRPLRSAVFHGFEPCAMALARAYEPSGLLRAASEIRKQSHRESWDHMGLAVKICRGARARVEASLMETVAATAPSRPSSPRI